MTETTCESLEPLLRGTWKSAHEAFLVLERHKSSWGPIVLRIGRQRGAPFAMSADDVVMETMLRIVSTANNTSGLTRPSECEHRSPTAWLVEVVKNKAIDVVRRKNEGGSGAARRSHSEWDQEHGRSTFDSIAASTHDPVDQLDARRRLRRFQQALLSAELPGHHALAATALHWPDLLSVELAQRACHARSDTKQGPARDAQTTWRLLVRWRGVHGERPRTSDSRRELAWILRSTNTTGPSLWRRADPTACASARDLLRKWAARGKSWIEERT